jgi:thiamine-phosphate pyrophosphorylase
MKENYRIIDVNLNRASEALRIIEEEARFNLNDVPLTDQLKAIRHKINNAFSCEYLKLIEARNSEEDVGPQVVNTSSRKTILDILKANFKRSQQALRVLEEYSKIDFPDISGTFEAARYDLYTLEKKMSHRAQQLHRKKQLDNRLLYLVTDRTQFGNDNDRFFDAISAAIKGGVSIVQLREKQAPTKDFINLARTVREICSQLEALFIINDRVDIAQTVQADGVHLGQEDMDITSARKILGELAIIGNSTHKPDDALNAMKNGADYIGVGPVFTTPTKPGRQAVGCEYIQWASNNVNIPFYAIGGIDANNVDQVIDAGATRVAVVRAIINNTSPDIVSETLLKKLTYERSHV